MNQMETEFAKGWLARSLGVAREDNPWKEGTLLFKMWDNGWVTYDTTYPFEN